MKITRYIMLFASLLICAMLLAGCAGNSGSPEEAAATKIPETTVETVTTPITATESTTAVPTPAATAVITQAPTELPTERITEVPTTAPTEAPSDERFTDASAFGHTFKLPADNTVTSNNEDLFSCFGTFEDNYYSISMSKVDTNEIYNDPTLDVIKTALDSVLEEQYETYSASAIDERVLIDGYRAVKYRVSIKLLDVQQYGSIVITVLPDRLVIMQITTLAEDDIGGLRESIMSSIHVIPQEPARISHKTCGVSYELPSYFTESDLEDFADYPAKYQANMNLLLVNSNIGIETVFSYSQFNLTRLLNQAYPSPKVLDYKMLDLKSTYSSVLNGVKCDFTYQQNGITVYGSWLIVFKPAEQVFFVWSGVSEEQLAAYSQITDTIEINY